VLACILSIVNDILLVKKAILHEFQKGGTEAETEAKSSYAEGDVDMNDADETLKSVAGGKKDLAL
nr:hypothetical protein [Tanacetum cinerariifolium]